MITPLDPVIAQIIPLLPLRDPAVMTPQSARDSLRALADARAAVPPPPVAEVKNIQVKARPVRSMPGPIATATKNRRPWCFSMAAAGSPAISKPMTGRRGYW